MEDVCILCNVLEMFWWKKVTKREKKGPFGTFKLQMALAQSCKNTSTCLCKHPNFQLLKGGIDQLGVDHDNSFLWLESH
jgi:hypothetical protein